MVPRPSTLPQFCRNVVKNSSGGQERYILESQLRAPLRQNMWAVVEALISLMHDCIERSNFVTLSRGADICNCKASKTVLCVIECELKTVEKGLMYIKKCTGQKTEHTAKAEQ